MSEKFCKHCQVSFIVPGEHWYADKKCKEAVRARMRTAVRTASPEQKEARWLYQKQYRESNREDHLLRCKEWQNQNKERHLANARSWYTLNRERARANQKGYHTRRERRDPAFKAARRIRTRLYLAAKKQLGGQRVVKEVGCTLPELRAHLERQFRDGMTWENHGTVWEIDHIYPISKIDLSTEEGQRRATHFSNLQPLLVAENRKKAARVNQEG